MMNLKAIFGVMAAIFYSANAFAHIDLSNVDNVGITLYGMYITDDATCSTGWSAISAFNANAVEQNFLDGPQIGSGAISSATQCILLIIKNSVNLTVKAGTYTGTTGGPDNVCNGGVTNHKAILYGESSFQQTAGLTWPASTEAPSADMIAASVAQITSFPVTLTGDEYVPVYVSTNSKCSGNATADAALSDCVTVDNAGSNSGNVPPTAVNDVSHGYHLKALPVSASSYNFIIDMSSAIGGNGSGVCSIGAAPPIYFE